MDVLDEALRVRRDFPLIVPALVGLELLASNELHLDTIAFQYLAFQKLVSGRLDEFGIRALEREQLARGALRDAKCSRGPLRFVGSFLRGGSWFVVAGEVGKGVRRRGNNRSNNLRNLCWRGLSHLRARCRLYNLPLCF